MGRQREIRCNGELLRRLRLDKGWTQEDAADRAKVSGRWVAKAEAGEWISRRYLSQYAGIFGKSLDELTFDPRSFVMRLLDDYRDLGSGIIEKYEAFIAPNALFEVRGDPSYLPFAGIEEGVPGLRAQIRRFFDVFERPNDGQLVRIEAADSWVFVVGDVQVRRKDRRDGMTIQSALDFRFSEGKLVGLWNGVELERMMQYMHGYQPRAGQEGQGVTAAESPFTSFRPTYPV